MVISKNSISNYKTLKTSIRVIIKIPEIQTLVSDYLKNKNMCKNAVKKLPFVIMYVLDRHKTQEMCIKVILEHD